MDAVRSARLELGWQPGGLWCLGDEELGQPELILRDGDHPIAGAEEIERAFNCPPMYSYTRAPGASG